MPTMILPAEELRRLIRQRRARGDDRHDEVWNGGHVLSTLADNEHQTLGFELAVAFKESLGEDARVQPGANVSNRAEGWRKNYRCPDVLVFLPGNAAEDRGTHWLGGPDFAVEVLSHRDRARKKLAFYAAVGVGELLLVDRRPWRPELHRLLAGRQELLGCAIAENGEWVTSAVLPVRFGLVAGRLRPTISVIETGDRRTRRI